MRRTVALLILAFGFAGMVWYKNREFKQSLVTNKGIEVSGQAEPFIKKAQEYVDAHRKTLRIGDHHRLVPQLDQNPLGTVVRYQVYEKNLPIMGMDITVHFSSRGSITQLENHYRALEPVSDEKTISEERILKLVTDRYGYQPTDHPISHILYAGSENDTAPTRAYVIQVRLSSGRPMQLMVRATDGLLLSRVFTRGGK